MFALKLARLRGLSVLEGQRDRRGAAAAARRRSQEVLETAPAIEEIAEQFKDATNFLYLGRGYNFPAALEGALKLKEITYIHAEGYPAAEMKHGPIALIDENMPVVFIAPHDAVFDKIVSNIQEVKARGGRVIAITSREEPALAGMLDYEIRIPETMDMLTPILASMPLQLLAYYIAVKRGAQCGSAEESGEVGDGRVRVQGGSARVDALFASWPGYARRISLVGTKPSDS